MEVSIKVCLFAFCLLQVNISFANTVSKPGEQTRLIIKAAQGSQVAISAVDKSVHLLKEGNELTEADVRFSLYLCYQLSNIPYFTRLFISPSTPFTSLFTSSYPQPSNQDSQPTPYYQRLLSSSEVP